MRQQLASRFTNLSGYRNVARPLTDEEIRAVAPSIFADAAHESRSSRYGYIPTIEVLNGLRREGFQPFMACQTRCRNEGKQDFTKHMLRLRHEGQIMAADAVPEIVLLNSHDGSSSYQMLAGMFRFVCHNGMIWGDTTYDIRVRHNAKAVDAVVDGAFSVLEAFQLVEESRDDMQTLALSHDEQHVFARAALTLRYEGEEKAPVTEGQILGARRSEDYANNVWTVFNRIQENLMRGGLVGRNAVLASDNDAALEAKARYEAVVYILNGRTFSGCMTKKNISHVVEHHCRAEPGTVPMWGQAGVFLVTVQNMRAIVEFQDGFAGHSHMAFYVVDPSRPFVSSTGYLSHFLIPQGGCTVDEAACAVLQEQITSRGRVMLEPEYLQRAENAPRRAWLPQGGAPAVCEEVTGQLGFAF
jgi:hypothetical protein